jgi:excisionase family DNA binding protein
MQKVPIWEKMNLSIEEAAAYSNIGINKLYEMVKDPKCSYTLYVGKKTLIKRKEFEKYLERVSEV